MRAAKAFTKLLAAAGIAALWFTAQHAIADEEIPPGEHKFELAKEYYAQCKGVEAEDFEKIREYLRAFTDVEVMADMMADPAKAAKLMTVVNDPRTMHVMMKCSTEPVMWDTWMHGLTDYNKLMRAAMRFMNPMVYMNWMMAPMNPAMYQPMMAFANPNYYMNWMNAAMNPTFYQPMFSMMDPNWYTPRLQWMMNPNSFQPLLGAFNLAESAPQPAAESAEPAAEPADNQ